MLWRMEKLMEKSLSKDVYRIARAEIINLLKVSSGTRSVSTDLLAKLEAGKRIWIRIKPFENMRTFLPQAWNFALADICPKVKSEFVSCLLPNAARLPFSIRVLLEAAIRNCDEFLVKKGDVENILNWKVMQHKNVEVPFKPARVILQDYT